MNDLQDIRDRVERLDEISGDDTAHAESLASEALRETAEAPEEIRRHARAEFFGARGTARRKMGRYRESVKDYCRALASCSCTECFPRIRRRQAVLMMCFGDLATARKNIDESIYWFAIIHDTCWLPRAVSVLAAVLRFGGNLRGAITTARYALDGMSMYPSPAFKLGTLQNLSDYLADAGEWAEVLTLLNNAQPQIDKVGGGDLRILKQKLRLPHIFAQLQMTGDKNRARKRLRRILWEMLGRGLSVHREDTDTEVERARRTAHAAPLDIAVILCDLAILGEDPKFISRIASEVLALKPEGGHIVRLLEALSDAADEGLDLSPFAHALRAECPGAPALPPALRQAA